MSFCLMSNLYSAADNFPLHAAVYAEKLSNIEELIQGGYNIEKKDYLGRTALNCAVVTGKESEVITLLKLRASCRAQNNLKQSVFHQTLLHSRKNLTIIRAILKSDPGLVYFSNNGSMPSDFPLVYAFMNNKSELFQLLIESALSCMDQEHICTETSIDMIPREYRIELVEYYERNKRTEKKVMLMSSKEFTACKHSVLSFNVKDQNKLIIINTLKNFENKLKKASSETNLN
ncbi:hypothetical protein COB28_02990 [Candidatus Dependentiae bacterium]|nr:MAG: hypothetical protein COB28_02990 [Candidatus Dependentiae bacterium]